MAHVDYAGNSECIDQRASGEETARQNQYEADDKERATEEDEPGFGLGLRGLASVTLPSESMVVPPLNFSMVRLAAAMPALHALTATAVANALLRKLS